MERVGGSFANPRLLLPALLAFLVPLLVPARLSAEVEMEGVLSRTGASLRWDASLGVGALVGGPNIITFRPGLSWVLLNFRERIETGAVSRRADGAVLFSDRAAAAIESALGRSPAEPAGESGKPRIAAIIIDAGHGGRDPGASHTVKVEGRQVDVVEKQIVLAVARELFTDLAARYPDKRIIMTRTSDSYLSLEKRTEIANAVPLTTSEAMIFISIHANASFDPTAKGFEIWYLPPSYRREVVDPGTLRGRPRDLYPILNSMREEEYTIESVLLAKKILASVEAQVGPAAPDRGLKAQSWYVVRDAKMPAILIELGFVTNESEARHLSDPSYLKKLSRGIYNGVSAFVRDFDDQAGFME